MKKQIFMITLLVLAFPITSYADRRNFVWTYEAKTLAKDEAELEYYFTTFANKEDGERDYSLDINHDIELEYGITDHFDVALYQLFRHQEGEDFKYRGYKIRGRYRFGVPGQYFMDPLIYVEFIHKPFSHEVELEEKIVFSKNLGHFLLAFNMTFEQEEKYKADSQEYKFVPQLALGYQVRPWLTVGAEFMGHTEVTSGNGYEHTAFLLGPTLSLSGKRVWWSLGTLVQATKVYDEHARFQVRSLLGIFL